MRLPTNNIAQAAVGFAAVVLLVPALMLLVSAIRALKHARQPAWLRSFFETLAGTAALNRLR